MKYKKTIILLLLAVFLLSITCVSASEMDNTIASEDTDSIELSADNDIIEDNMQISEEINDETVSTSNGGDIFETDNSGVDEKVQQKNDISINLSEKQNFNDNSLLSNFNGENLVDEGLKTPIIINVEGRPTTAATIVHLSLDEKINGYVKIYEDENDYNSANVNIINGTGEYIFEYLSRDRHDINVIFEGNEYFAASSNVTSIVVYEDPGLEIESFPKTIYASDDLTFYFSLYGIDDKYSIRLVNITLIHGDKIQNRILYRNDIWDNDMDWALDVGVTFESLEIGEYSLIIHSYNTYNFGDSKLVKTFNVVAKDPKLSIDASDIVKGETAVISISIDDKFDGDIICLFDEVIYPINFTNGVAKLSLNNLDYGVYTINVTASNTTNYTYESIKKSFKVLNDPYLEVYAENSIYGQIALVNISINADITGNLSVYVDSEKYPIELSQGKATISISDLNKGSHHVLVEFEGDENYLPSSKSVDFSVTSNPETALLSQLIDEIGDGILILQKDYTLNSTIDISNSITIDGAGHIIDACGLSKIFNVNWDNVNLKNIIFKNAYSTTNGGAVYSSYRHVYYNNCTFINCSSTSSGGAIYGNYGEIINCTFIDCKGNYGGAVYLSSSSLISSSISNCEFRNCIATTSGGAFYGMTITNSYIVNCTAKYGGGIYSRGDIINLTIENCSASTRGGAVDWHFLAYTGNMYNSTLINCNAPKASFIYTGGDEIVHYNCYNTRFENVLDKTKMNAAEQNLPVLINCTTLLSSNLEVSISSVDKTSAVVSISILPEASGKVILSVNGKIQNVDLIDGKRNITVSDLSNGNLITVEFIASGNFTSMSKTVTFTAPVDNNAHDDESEENTTVVVNPKITASNLNAVYTSGSAFKVTVYGTDGKLASGASVVIKVAGKKVATVKTVNGIATYKTTQIPGTYKISATALGKTVTKTLTVKHLVTLKSVSVKRSAKTLVIQASLAKVNGKYLKSKKITFKFNGKKYTAKTNAKGVAKLTIKSSVLKKLKAGKKVTYQATYLKDTVKKTVKIKK